MKRSTKASGSVQEMLRDRSTLESSKTAYAIKGGGWLEDYSGASRDYPPAEEGGEQVKIELLPQQAEYYLLSGQVAPIPGETKGHPVDATTGEQLELTAVERAQVQAQPSLERAATVDDAATLVETPPSASSTLDDSPESPSKQRRGK